MPGVAETFGIVLPNLMSDMYRGTLNHDAQKMYSDVTNLTYDITNKTDDITIFIRDIMIFICFSCDANYDVLLVLHYFIHILMSCLNAWFSALHQFR